MTKNPTSNALSQGIFRIIDTETGKVQTDKKLDIILRMEELNIPGLSLTIINDYRILETLVYGKRDTLSEVDNHTLFQAASVSKYVTAVIVHHFIKEGLLELDTDINQYLKSWKVPANDFTEKTPITLRHLLTHQSGLPGTNLDYDKEKGVPTLLQILNAESPAINKPAIPQVIPGSLWSYSNIGYVLIQKVMEDVTDKSFEDLAQEILFEPLDMKSSTFRYPLPEVLRDREAKPFTSDGLQQSPDLTTPAKAQGGLMTTTEDLAKLTTEVLSACRGASDIFSKELVKGLLSKELELPFKFYEKTAYMGQGVLLLGAREDLAFIHNGYNAPGSVCIVIGFPELGKGAVIACNSANGEHLYLEVIATLAEAYKWPSGQFFKD